jgi:hypothetical protein
MDTMVQLPRLYRQILMGRPLVPEGPFLDECGVGQRGQHGNAECHCPEGSLAIPGVTTTKEVRDVCVGPDW